MGPQSSASDPATPSEQHLPATTVQCSRASFDAWQHCSASRNQFAANTSRLTLHTI